MKKSILIVEDNDDLRHLISDVLKAYHILQAQNPVEAFKILPNKEIDLIITDIQMPLMSGDQFIKQLRFLNIQTPVCVVSSSITEELKAELHNDVIWFLEKPFVGEHLQEVVKLFLNPEY